MTDPKLLPDFLNSKVDEYNHPSFIKEDPISVPHQFSKKQDIEIAGLFAAIFAWGNRTTIINKSTELMQLMDNAPYDFCMNPTTAALKRLMKFKHRTFNTTDLLYFISFLQAHYSKHKSLETAFTMHGKSMEEMLTGFHNYFFSLEHTPERTRKHIATPARQSACKRLNMYLRWMVRQDDKGVDFGIWIDLHVARVARRFNLITRKQTDWQTALELTEQLKKFDKDDPVKYDFALFSLGVIEKY